MPNWCDNTITIRGSRECRDSIRDYLKSKEDGEALSLNNLIPVPEELLKDDWQRDKAIAAANKEKHGYDGWYDWRVAKWGTKWEVADVQIFDEDKHLMYNFQSAWSPVSAWVKALSAKYPEVAISHEFHEEGGMYPSAVEVYEEGSLLSSTEIPNPNFSEDEEE